MIFALFAPLFLSFFLTIDAEVKYTNSTSMDEGRYKLWWTFINATDTFHFKVEVEANGWIGFGITQLEYGDDWMRNGMDTYDVLVAGVYGNGSIYGLDYLTSGQNRSQYPTYANVKNDWNITMAKEIGQKTTLEFKRKRLTSEPVNTHFSPRKGDIQVMPGLRYFAWAYHKTIDTPYLNNVSLVHDKSGLEPVMLLPLQDDRETIVITHPSPTAGTNIPECSMATFFVIIMLLNLFV